MLFQISIIASLAGLAMAQSNGMGGVVGNTSFAQSTTVCAPGFGPMNVTSGNWATAQKYFGNYTPYAWIASYNGDTYNGACLSFGGNSVNVPASCNSPAVGTLCAPIDPPSSTASPSSMPVSSTPMMSASMASSSVAPVATAAKRVRSNQSWH